MRRFDPRSISGLVSWMRSDQVTLSSGKVSAWQDLSGNGKGTSQATAAQQPTYVASGGLKGLPYLLCGQGGTLGVANPNASRLSWDVGALSGLTAFEIFGVFECDSTQHCLPWTFRATDTAGTIDICIDTNRGIYLGDCSTVRNTQGILAATTGAVIVNVHSATNDFQAIVKRGASTLTETRATNTFVAPDATGPCLFSQNYQAANAQTYYAQGPAYECAIYGRVLTTAERALMNAYISGRYGTL